MNAHIMNAHIFKRAIGGPWAPTLARMVAIQYEMAPSEFKRNWLDLTIFGNLKHAAFRMTFVLIWSYGFIQSPIFFIAN